MKKGYIYSIIGAILFGTAGMFVKLAYESGIEATSLLTLQYIIAVTLMFALALIMDRSILKVNRKQLYHLIILGVIGNTFMTIFYYKAFEYLPVAMVTMLLYTYPIIVLIYVTIFKKQKLTKYKLIAIGLAFGGCLLTLNIFNGEFKYSVKGIIFGVLSAVFYAFMNLYSEEKLENMDSLAINAYSTAASLIILLIYNFPSFIFKQGISMSTLGYITILAVFCEIIPLTLLYASIKYIGSFKVSIINNLEIPTAMLISFLILGEKIGIYQILGAIMIVGAIYLIKE